MALQHCWKDATDANIKSISKECLVQIHGRDIMTVLCKLTYKNIYPYRAAFVQWDWNSVMFV
jgi:hypothetical protein